MTRKASSQSREAKRRADLHTWSAIAILHREDAVMTREQSVLYVRKRPVHARTRASCSVLKTFWPVTKLTIPGHPIGRPPCQRPAPLPGCSAGKHRRSPRSTIRHTAASANATEDWLLRSAQKHVRGGGAQNLSFIAQCRSCGADGIKGFRCRRADRAAGPEGWQCQLIYKNRIKDLRIHLFIPLCKGKVEQN